MEYAWCYPSCHTEIGYQSVVGSEGIGGGDLRPDEGETMGVGGIVEEGEQDGGWFLNTEETRKGPLSVVLLYRMLWGDEGLGCEGLAGVIALRRTGPEEKFTVERWTLLETGKSESMGFFVRIERGWVESQFSRMQTCKGD